MLDHVFHIEASAEIPSLNIRGDGFATEPCAAEKREATADNDRLAACSPQIRMTRVIRGLF